jgi:hypothetical protein
MLRARLLSIVLLLLLAGCSSEPSKPAQSAAAPKPEKPPESVTGREAFQKLYATARQWASDARPVRLESQPLAGADGHDGKAMIWRAAFASPGKRGIEGFTWSGAASPDAPERGITHGTEDTWSPTNASTQPFDFQFLKNDSSDAAAVAQKHGGEKALKANSKLPLMFLLDWDARKNELVWHVIYGSNRDEAKLTVDVDASSGEFLRVEK